MQSASTKQTCAPDRTASQCDEGAKLGRVLSNFPQTTFSHNDSAPISHEHGSAKLEFIHTDMLSFQAGIGQFLRGLPSDLNPVGVAESIANSTIANPTLAIIPAPFDVPLLSPREIRHWSLNIPVANSCSPSPPTQETAPQSPDSSLSVKEVKEPKPSKPSHPILPGPPTRPPPPPPIVSAMPTKVKYPLGHTFTPPNYQPFPNEAQITITTKNAQRARTFIGCLAIRLVEAYRISGYDMRIHELKGPWQAVGGRRWKIDMRNDQREEVLERMLNLAREAIVRDREKRLIGTPTGFKDLTRLNRREMEGLRDQMRGARKKSEQERDVWTPEEWLGMQCESMVRDPVFMRTRCGVKYAPSWNGAHESTGPLQPRQRPLRPGCRSDGLIIWEDERDETNCTSYCHLSPVMPIIGVYEIRKHDYCWKYGQAAWPTFFDGRVVAGETIDALLKGTTYSNPHKKRGRLVEDLEALDRGAKRVSDLMNIRWKHMAELMVMRGLRIDEETESSMHGYNMRKELDRKLNWTEARGREELNDLIALTQVMMKCITDEEGGAPSEDNEASDKDHKLSFFQGWASLGRAKTIAHWKDNIGE
jgi:hypothetical protein